MGSRGLEDAYQLLERLRELVGAMLLLVEVRETLPRLCGRGRLLDRADVGGLGLGRPVEVQQREAQEDERIVVGRLEAQDIAALSALADSRARDGPRCVGGFLVIGGRDVLPSRLELRLERGRLHASRARTRAERESARPNGYLRSCGLGTMREK